jgi:hypothetical protein
VCGKHLECRVLHLDHHPHHRGADGGNVDEVVQAVHAELLETSADLEKRGRERRCSEGEWIRR